MSFWEVFWTLNDLIWPVYVSLIVLWLVAIIIIHLADWRHSRKNDHQKVK